MGIEWEEKVETKRRVALVVDLKPSDPFDAPDEVRAATIDDLRRACEAAGLVVADAEAAETASNVVEFAAFNVKGNHASSRAAWAAVVDAFDALTKSRDEAVEQRDEARKDCHAAVDRALEAHRVLGAKHDEGTLEAAKRVVAERDDARCSFDAACARLAHHLADGVHLVGSLPLAIDVLAQRAKDAVERAEKAEAKAAQHERDWYDAKSEFGTASGKLRERIATVEADLTAARGELASSRARVSELTAECERQRALIAELNAACAMLGGDPKDIRRAVSDALSDRDKANALLSVAHQRIATLEADLAAARDRIAELEAPMPEATVAELGKLAHDTDQPGTAVIHWQSNDARRHRYCAMARAVAERVRRERCLVARAVAGGVRVSLTEYTDAWRLRVEARSGGPVVSDVHAAEVPSELARMLTEVGA